MRKETTSVDLPSRLVDEAEKLGFNVSKSCEIDLQRRIRLIDSDIADSFKVPQSTFQPKIIPSKEKFQKTYENPEDSEELINDFQDFCEVDLNLAESTIERHKVVIRDFLEYFDDLNGLARKDVRDYLKNRKKDEAEATYANRIKALRKFLRDFLNAPYLIESFELPSPKPKNYDIPNKSDLQKFYKHLPNEKYEAIFLFFATTGLRTGEVIGLKMNDLDFNKCIVIPNHESATKRSYLTFYNEETEEALEDFLPQRNEEDERLFQTTDRPVQKSFERTSKRSGVKLKPKTLRKWFAKEMRNLGVPGEHIDAFCGRLPKSVRAKHYTDYSPERLEEVYEKADIRVLE